MITQSTAQFRCVAARQLFALLRAVASRLQLILMRAVSYRNKRLDWIQSLSLDSGKTRPLVFLSFEAFARPCRRFDRCGRFPGLYRIGTGFVCCFFWLDAQFDDLGLKALIRSFFRPLQSIHNLLRRRRSEPTLYKAVQHLLTPPPPRIDRNEARRRRTGHHASDERRTPRARGATPSSHKGEPFARVHDG